MTIKMIIMINKMNIIINIVLIDWAGLDVVVVVSIRPLAIVWGVSETWGDTGIFCKKILFSKIDI